VLAARDDPAVAGACDGAGQRAVGIGASRSCASTWVGLGQCPRAPGIDPSRAADDRLEATDRAADGVRLADSDALATCVRALIDSFCTSSATRARSKVRDVFRSSRYEIEVPQLADGVIQSADEARPRMHGWPPAVHTEARVRRRRRRAAAGRCGGVGRGAPWMPTIRARSDAGGCERILGFHHAGRWPA
jgi:hypothetical protein